MGPPHRARRIARPFDGVALDLMPVLRARSEPACALRPCGYAPTRCRPRPTRPSGATSTTRSSPPACARGAPRASSPARSTCSGYEDDLPVQLQDDGPDRCSHGDKGCDICTLACPRFRDWEGEIDTTLFGMTRKPEELIGHHREIVLARATDAEIAHDRTGRRRGLAPCCSGGCAPARSTARCTSKLSDERPWDAEPTVVTDAQGVLDTAGLALHVLRQPARAAQGGRDGAVEGRARRHELPGERHRLDGGTPGEQVAQEDRLDVRAAVLEDLHLRRTHGRDRAERARARPRPPRPGQREGQAALLHRRRRRAHRTR